MNLSFSSGITCSVSNPSFTSDIGCSVGNPSSAICIACSPSNPSSGSGIACSVSNPTQVVLLVICSLNRTRLYLLGAFLDSGTMWPTSYHCRVFNEFSLCPVYGRYDDVSLCAFAETQLSTTHRTEWDPSALDLRVLEADEAIREQRPAHGADTYSAQDLLYWLVKFPVRQRW